MKRNVGRKDGLVRVAIAVLIVAFQIWKDLQGTAGMALLLGAGALLLTAYFGFCSFYAIAGFNTCEDEDEDLHF